MNIYFYDYVIISWMHNNVKDVKTGVNNTLPDISTTQFRLLLFDESVIIDKKYCGLAL